MSEKRPNVLFLFDDQHHASCLGLAGHPFIQTPNLDALSRRGTIFESMYTCSAICGPSRTSFFLGNYLRTHNHFFNDGDLLREFPSMLTELGKAGYTRVQSGKNHLPFSIANDFDALWTDGTLRRELDERGVELPPQEPGWHQNFMSSKWDMDEKDHRAVWTAQKTIDFLNTPEAKENPFFIWTSFAPPHAPHVPPEELDDLYNPDDIPVDWEEYFAFERSRMQNRPMIEDFWKAGSVRHDIDIFKKAVCRYLSLITLVDREIGRVLSTLRGQGLDDDTIIIFTADHGDFAGNFGQLGKNLPGYEDLLRIPFIYVDPYREDHGRHVQGMYQNVDLFPSLMERLGLPVPHTVQGRSFLPALDGCPGSSRDYIFAETSMEKTIQSRDWKLTFFVRHPERGQLFRMSPTPNELENLWDNPDYTHIKAKLMSEMMTWMVSCEQPGCMCSDWEEYISTPWYDWLRGQPDQVAVPGCKPRNEK